MKKLFIALSLVTLALVMALSACSAAPPRATTVPSTSAPAMTRPATTTAAPTYVPSTTRPPAPTTAAPVPTITWPAGSPPPPVVITQVPAPSITIPGTTSAPSYGKQETIGLATGGAKDINNFRENINNNYLPLPTDITFEGLFYDYYFDTGTPAATNKLYAPAYSYAVTRDPLSGQTEYYLAVGLRSGMTEADFARKKLNLVIVLDDSGSMGEQYNQYYYDRYGNRVDAYEGESITRRTKMASANDAVVSILNQLNDGDRFAIVLFNSNASLLKPMALVRNTNMYDIEDKVLDINAGGSTNLAAGLKMATDQFRNLREVNSYDYENRIIVLTDAQPNTGDYSSSGLEGIMTTNANSRIYTTVIGIGVDFNTQLIEEIIKVKGANYYSVHSPREFRERVDDEFDFMVTPLIFNLRMSFESKGWRIDKVFGSPEADQATGQLMKINTLFPSKSEGGEVKGGLVLLKLRKMSTQPDEKIYLRVTYEDRNGRSDGSAETIYLEGTPPEYFENTGIEKGVLLTRYAALLQNWMIDEYNHAYYSRPWDPVVSDDTGITIPPDPFLSRWERTSTPLTVSEPYKRIFRKFLSYFEKETNAIGDYTLDQEIDILNKLSR